ncbi:hypothetical protein HMPREF9466_00604 [Fusobacterium necrophorum subsp. funduliforme 1_1_36S]|nr:hypothetical protein HMPREF9466_00604 [Fusobacterium necrophorum subsp. funduliforme 1_1_36S]
MKRVVVTGLGMISPLANNVEESWERLLNGECGILKIQSYDASEMPVQIAAEVKILILWTLELRKRSEKISKKYTICDCRFQNGIGRLRIIFRNNEPF